MDVEGAPGRDGVASHAASGVDKVEGVVTRTHRLFVEDQGCGSAATIRNSTDERFPESERQLLTLANGI
ncbi:hypothetical protein M422DRAFT_256184 [Sphaerobolus stellatus SS14]|uniref:Uncharacterized protein n=1 Tax=Sphaerobolus stellatus (strain SS14) TaxID=990650 RepID=A0A0C9UCE1_SPHS4|nr:hypothetical protein M422DRAFT_256184 [Sphaerobolus stellatus SS14]